MTDDNGFKNALTLVPTKRPSVEISIVKRKGQRARYEYSGDGRWNNEAIAQVMLLSKERWFEIPELARIAFRSASSANQKKARLRISLLQRHCFEYHHRVLIKEYERKTNDVQIGSSPKKRKEPLKGRNVIARVKLAGFDDKELAQSELDERYRHNEITREQLLRMMDILRSLPRPEPRDDEPPVFGYGN